MKPGIHRPVAALATLPLFLACLAADGLSGCSKKVDEPTASGFKPAGPPPLPPGPETLQIADEKIGTGREVTKGDAVKVHYTGRLMNGKQFDSSVGKDPFEFTIGAGGVIKGWDEGVVGMRVGGKRKLTVPWQLAYGEAGSGDNIPSRAALMFDIELLEIVPPGQAGSAPAMPGDMGDPSAMDPEGMPPEEEP